MKNRKLLILSFSFLLAIFLLIEFFLRQDFSSHTVSSSKLGGWLSSRPALIYEIPRWLEENSPATIILGSSNVINGIDAEELKKVKNKAVAELGMSSLNFKELRQVIRWLINNTNPLQLKKTDFVFGLVPSLAKTSTEPKTTFELALQESHCLNLDSKIAECDGPLFYLNTLLLKHQSSLTFLHFPNRALEHWATLKSFVSSSHKSSYVAQDGLVPNPQEQKEVLDFWKDYLDDSYQNPEQYLHFEKMLTELLPLAGKITVVEFPLPQWFKKQTRAPQEFRIRYKNILKNFGNQTHHLDLSSALKDNEFKEVTHASSQGAKKLTQILFKALDSN